jgi:hypothetical protein
LILLIQLSQINPDYQLSDKVVVAGDVEETWSEKVAAEKEDKVGMGLSCKQSSC